MCAIKKDCGLTILPRLTPTRHSLARTHYRPARELLAAGCPPWPVASLLRSNLIPSDSSQGSMLMLALVRTPVQHDQVGIS
jgi:hypothetical protein